MTKETNKLYFFLLIAGFVILVFVLLFVHVFFPAAWHGIIDNLICDLLAAAFVAAFLYLFFDRKFKEKPLGEQASELIKQALPSTEELKVLIREEIAALDAYTNNMIELVRSETNEIDKSLAELAKSMELLLSRKPNNSWEEHYPILIKLRGRWIEYIPSLEASGHEYSIAEFDLDTDGKHCFAGRNYHHNGAFNYAWTTLKLLPPLRHDPDTLFLYYLYKRERNPDHEDQYGFGKLVAKRKGVTTDDYDFVEGFFFNEAASQGGQYKMQLLRLTSVANVLGVNSEKVESSEENVRTLLDAVKNKRLFKSDGPGFSSKENGN